MWQIVCTVRNQIKSDRSILLRDNRGMATIEACIIIPVCIAVTMLLIWFGLYSYDRIVCAGSVHRAVIYASSTPELDNSELADICQDKLSQELEDNLVYLKNPRIEINVDYGTITARVEGDFEVPGIFNFGGIYGRDSWYIEEEAAAPRLRHSMVVRAIAEIAGKKG